ncbi:hypothetical protein ABK040_006612 [Willaertia magna]
MHKLPNELLTTQIFTYSSLFDNFRYVCKCWKELIEEEEFLLINLKNHIGFLDCDITKNKLPTLQYIKYLLQNKYKDYFEFKRIIKELNFNEDIVNVFNKNLEFKLFIGIESSLRSNVVNDEEECETREDNKEEENEEDEEQQYCEEERKKRKLDIVEKLMTNIKEDNCDIGQSKFGGFPDLPKSYFWPKDNFNNDLLFVCQLNIKHLTFFDLSNKFPKKDGMLYFWIPLNTNNEEPSNPNLLTCVNYLSEKEIKEMGNLERRINPIVSNGGRSEFCYDKYSLKKLPYFCYPSRIQFVTVVTAPDESITFESAQLMNNLEEINKIEEDKIKYRNLIMQHYTKDRAVSGDYDNEEYNFIDEEIIYRDSPQTNYDEQQLISFEGSSIGLYPCQSFFYIIDKEAFNNGNFSRAFYIYWYGTD